ncbi:Ig-like domain-containing protein [Polyangium aurulentum]|uniref:Ig-like domain-containing protein n=1 Tax=Polyangium aurulentum TaxID=2567896 RepID=UPI0010ADEB90|nr:Ig-like domain-containing protein [Polyangium aurulentum]UQA55766.1 lamin tail domain-containing protein [Polyangium aurulentum]
MRRTTMAMAALAILASGAGCELIAGVDRSKIDEAAGGAAGGSSTASNTGGMAGMGGMAGAGGIGGMGGMAGSGGIGGMGGMAGAGGIGGMGGMAGSGGMGGMGGMAGAGGIGGMGGMAGAGGMGGMGGMAGMGGMGGMAGSGGGMGGMAGMGGMGGMGGSGGIMTGTGGAGGGMGGAGGSSNECNVDADCPTGVCQQGVCVTTTCLDGTQNGTETDVDCGGPNCVDCVPGKGCVVPSDCQTGVCTAGTCGPLAVLSTTPADAATSVTVTSKLRVQFTGHMDPLTLSAQTSSGPCTGSIQISTDDFATCIGFSSATPVLSLGQMVATLTPAPALSYGTSYKVRVTAAVKDAYGNAMAAAYTSTTGFTTELPPATCEGSVVISQVYPVGGYPGATYTNDFIELHNRGNTPVDLAGWSVQHTSASGFAWLVTNLSGSIAPGGYYLVQMGAGGLNGDPLPTPDATGNTLLGTAGGKVALVNSTAMLPNGCPNGASYIDFVGYGTATCAESLYPAPAPISTQSIQRAGGGCADMNNNAADFVVANVVPRNSTTAALACSCLFTANESGALAEVDYCNVQFPQSISVQAAQMTPVVYGRIYELGTTEAMGANASVKAEIGFGPETINPSTQSGWQFFPATFNVQVNNDDEYQATLLAPATAGTYRYAYRFSLDGTNWTYCDINGAGANGGLSFEVTQLPVMTVTP